jgi:hypothetical protein
MLKEDTNGYPRARGDEFDILMMQEKIGTDWFRTAWIGTVWPDFSMLYRPLKHI